MRRLFGRARGGVETPPRPAPILPSDTCRAPYVALRLAPTGNVHACCVNEDFPLGSVREQSLREIWEGSRFDQLRRAMDVADFSLGCEGCGGPREAGLRSITLAVDFDKFAQPTELTWPKSIEFALSNTCNLQCVQCNGELSSAIRAQREHRKPLGSHYDDQFFEDLREFLPHLESAMFIGGEPFLARENRRVWDMMIELGVQCDVWVTTNGTQWDDRVEHYLHALRMGVSLSIDGVEPATIAASRVGADPHQLLVNRDRYLAATRSYGASFKLNYCVMPHNWSEYMPFLLDAEGLGVRVYSSRVLRPAEHSLFALPIDAFRAVVDGMVEQEAAHGGELSINRSVWTDTIEELTAHLRRLEGSAVPVELPGTGGNRAEPELPSFEELHAALSQGGQAPVCLRVVDGRVTTVDVPGWAEFLGLDACVGMPEDSLLPAIEGRFGALAMEPVDGEGAINGVVCRFTRDGEPVELHSVAIPAGDGCRHVLVGLVAQP